MTWEYEENKVRRGSNDQHILIYLAFIDNDSHDHESRRKGIYCLLLVGDKNGE
jgi:hypothetical protein